MENGFDISYLIPGTDGPTIAWYRGLPQRAQESFELLEDEVVVVDTETTGLDPSRDQLIEIAACILRGPEVVEHFQTFVNPGRPIPAEITELTGITQEDVDGAPDPSLAVELFATWADGRDLVAHNASFDKGVIMRQAQPGSITGRWMDSLALSRIVLPRMRGHRLADLSRAFGLHASTHRATDDVEATAGLWRILMAGVYSLPAGMAQLIASLSPQTSWPLRHLFAQAAQMTPGTEDWSLRRSRSRRFIEDNLSSITDLEEDEPPAVFPTDDELRRAFSAQGAAGLMYQDYEPRPEQLAMALEVGEALRSGTHRSLEAGTGVGKSMAYLLPLALAAKANPGMTVGVATKTNALMDQLVYSELPRLDAALGGLRYIALKGYDHYPCLRKLESMVRDREQERRPDVVEMLATLLAYVSQTPWGDLDALSLPWYGLPRYAVVASSDDCLKSRCPFFPTRCYLHGARCMASKAEVVVTNHALLFRDVQADNAILPEVKQWVIDEAHAVEQEARKQLSFAVSAVGLESHLHRLSGQHGTLGQIRRKSLELEGGVVLQGRCSLAEQQADRVRSVAASFFSFVKDLGDVSRDRGSGYDRITLWIDRQLRESGPWLALEGPGRSLSRKLDELVRTLTELHSSTQEFEELATLAADLNASLCRLDEGLAALNLVLEGTDEEFVYSAQVDRGTERPAEELRAERLDVGAVLAGQPRALCVLPAWDGARLARRACPPGAPACQQLRLRRQHAGAAAGGLPGALCPGLPRPAGRAPARGAPRHGRQRAHALHQPPGDGGALPPAQAAARTGGHRAHRADARQLHQGPARPLPRRQGALAVRPEELLGGLRRPGGDPALRGHPQAALWAPQRAPLLRARAARGPQRMGALQPARGRDGREAGSGPPHPQLDGPWLPRLGRRPPPDQVLRAHLPQRPAHLQHPYPSAGGDHPRHGGRGLGRWQRVTAPTASV